MALKDPWDAMLRRAADAGDVPGVVAMITDRNGDTEFFPGVEKSWGLSFQINEQRAPTGMPAGSLMWAGLANCYYWIDPKNGIGGVYASQILPFADLKSYPLFLELQTAVYDSLG